MPCGSAGAGATSVDVHLFCSRSLVDTVYALKDEVQELRQVSWPKKELKGLVLWDSSTRAVRLL